MPKRHLKHLAAVSMSGASLLAGCDTGKVALEASAESILSGADRQDERAADIAEARHFNMYRAYRAMLDKQAPVRNALYQGADASLSDRERNAADDVSGCSPREENEGD